MDATELAFAGIARQAELIRSREVSSRELVELYLERIERLDPRLNAFRVVLAERALAEADEADRRVAAGMAASPPRPASPASPGAPLLGVPVALKDEEDVAGEVTAYGTGAYDEPAAADSRLVRSLRDAGAVIIGKTNLPELAIYGFTESRTWSVTRNPWNLERTPGGSSGGSAAAVAAGLVGAASASDGAGSIRIPAAYCGLFGLKPQRGRVPLSGDGEHWLGLSVTGCLTRSVLDTALYLDVTAAGAGAVGAGRGATPPRPASPASPAPPPPARPFVESARSRPGKLRIAVSLKPVPLPSVPFVGDEAKRALEETGELLRSLGHDVRAEDPRYRAAGTNAATRYLRGIYEDAREVPHPERLERRTRGVARMGSFYPRAVVARARRAEGPDSARIYEIFERFDVLLMPTAGGVAHEVGRWEGRSGLRTVIGMSRRFPFTTIWNHTGQPAAAVPVGFTEDGLPLSVQLVGRYNDEATLLSLAAQIEAERPWADRRPPVS